MCVCVCVEINFTPVLLHYQVLKIFYCDIVLIKTHFVEETNCMCFCSMKIYIKYFDEFDELSFALLHCLLMILQPHYKE